MFQYFAVHKPYQVMSLFSPVENKKTLKDFFSVPTNVYPVGRLDYDSEGLLILTNEAAFHQKLLNPVFLHEREYWVQVDGILTQQALQHLQQGVDIHVDRKIYHTKKCKAILFDEEPKVSERNPPVRFRKNIPTTWLKLILTEGKNRQVRKMTAAVGFPTLRLIRYRIENINLENLQPGEMIELNKETIYKNLFL
jgi:23S rRNA pseudouridine2457 synthase